MKTEEAIGWGKGWGLSDKKSRVHANHGHMEKPGAGYESSTKRLSDFNSFKCNETNNSMQ